LGEFFLATIETLLSLRLQFTLIGWDSYFRPIKVAMPMPAPRILYCVLNWGLGHATRSIPVIRALMKLGYEVEIASDGGPLKFLMKTFPACVSHELPGYNIIYPTRSVLLNAASQLRNMFRAVQQEKKHIDKLISTQKYDVIISDNRYGCYHSGIPSILITHQLSNLAKSSFLSRHGERIVNRYFKFFDEVWIPDTQDRQLSGKLTDVSLPNMRFIGHLSDQVYEQHRKEYKIAAILSGPEPQRTKLEKEILPQLAEYADKCVLIRGLINDETPKHEGNLTIYPYMDRKQINDILNTSDFIVCRTGYSSLMDLFNIGAKAILIPTPGQPEQIYLGDRLKDNPAFVVQKQGAVDIAAGVGQLVKRRFIRQDNKEANALLSDALNALKQR
jgi:uncharacterized protein (TIGR00661 family)